MIFKEKLQKEFEITAEFNRREVVERNQVFKAIENALELSRQELLNRDSQVSLLQKQSKFNSTLREAVDNILEMHREKSIEHDKIFKGIEQTLELSRHELITSAEKIKTLKEENLKLKEEREKI